MVSLRNSATEYLRSMYPTKGHDTGEKLEKIAQYIERLEEALEVRDRSRKWFVSGASTNVDENGLPDSVAICPAYGADWAKIYKKVEE